MAEFEQSVRVMKLAGMLGPFMRACIEEKEKRKREREGEGTWG